MKTIVLLISILATTLLNAQTQNELDILIQNSTLTPEQIKTINENNILVKEENNQLIILDSMHIKKGDNIQIYLPTYGKDFYFVEQKKGLLNAKLIGSVAEVIGTGAGAIGIGSGNINTMSKALKVMNKTTAIKYGADAINKINELPISKKAKKIAGKKMEVLEWENQEGNHIITAKYKNKKYLIDLENAFITGEIKM